MQLTVKRLLKNLSANSDLIEYLFLKRDSAVTLANARSLTKDGKIERLVQIGLLVANDGLVELEEDFRTFLESVLDSNDEIEIGNIGDWIDDISHNILLYNNADTYERRQRFIKRIDRILKKIPLKISKSLIKLHQHIHLTYKSADAFALKRIELQRYKEKLEQLMAIDQRIETMLSAEADFFKHIAPQATATLYYHLKAYLTQMRISLVDLQRQVVDYINRVSPDVTFVKHITRLKELKNAYEIRELTNIEMCVRKSLTPLALLPKIQFSSQLETTYGQTIEFGEYVESWYEKQRRALPTRKEDEEIEAEFFDEEAVETYLLDLDALHLEFQESQSDLFTFIINKEFSFSVDFEERLGAFCDMAGLYAHDYILSDEYRIYNNYEYLVIYPKER
ncbi:MAG: hypothetical protein DSY46_07585 [Hydrogenimonas sp.]|nr:MAG: hypothetical protein DSY46_07585 [Hydrogenimonas sp.]